MDYCIADMSGNTPAKKRVLSVHETYEKAIEAKDKASAEKPARLIEILERQPDGKFFWPDEPEAPTHS